SGFGRKPGLGLRRAGAKFVEERRSDRGRGGGRRTAAERDVSRRARKQAPGSGAHFGQNAQAFHPDFARRSSSGRALAVRLEPRSNRVPLEVGADEGVGDESTDVGQTDLPEVQGRPPQGRSAGDLRERETQAAPGIGQDRNEL